jgi:UDP:flavonoid glycosyltransferase YjiC (YdhE family)
MGYSTISKTSVGMEKCLIIPAPIRSHVIPSFYLASIFSEKFEIIYACYEGELDEIVQTNGFINRIITSERFALGFDPVDSWQKHGYKFSIRFLVSAIKNGLTMTTYKKRKVELSKLITELKPKLILIDIFSSTDFLIVKSLSQDITIAFFNPMLNTYNAIGYANVKGELNTNIKKKFPILDSIKNVISPIRFLAKLTGYDPVWQLNYIYKNNPVLQQYPIDNDNKVVRLFKFVPELVLAPKELEFSEFICRKNQLYLGLCQSIKRIDTLIDKTFYLKVEDIFKSKLETSHPLIYCSFGSYFSSVDEHKYIISFCLYLIKAFQNKSMLFVISVKKEIIETIAKYTTIPSNFFFFTRVPQLTMLKEANLFITHGGLGSIKEAIFMKVPMLVYPLDLSWDQKGNAQKIEFHQIGISGNFKTDGLNEIEQKVLKLLRDPVYKQRIIALSNQCSSIENYTTNFTTIGNFIKLQL